MPVAGGEAYGVVRVIPDQGIVGAADVVVSAFVRLAAPAVVHDSGAFFVGNLKVGVRSGVKPGRAAAGQDKNGGRTRHAFELAVAGGSIAAHGAGHVGAVPAAVIPFVVASALVGYAAGGAAADALSFEVRVDVVKIAVVKTGVMEADRLRGSVVSVHYEIFQIAAVVGPRHVVHSNGVRVALDGGDFAHFGEDFYLLARQAGGQGRADVFRDDIVFHALIVQNFLDRRQKLRSSHSHQYVALVVEGRRAVDNIVEFADRFVFRQEFPQIDEGKNLP